MKHLFTASRQRLLASLILAFLCSCKATLHLGPLTITGEIALGSGTPCTDANSLGEASVEMEDGTVFEGEAFDTDGDGQPDRFKPHKGQKGESDKYKGETNGTDWYEFKPK